MERLYECMAALRSMQWLTGAQLSLKPSSQLIALAIAANQNSFPISRAGNISPYSYLLLRCPLDGKSFSHYYISK